MKSALRYVLPFSAAMLLAVMTAATAHAQFYKLKGGSISVGGTGQFDTTLTSNGNVASTGTNQQFTTWSAGFVSSLQFHPVSWAGVEFNYGFTHYQERYAFYYPTSSSQFRVNVPTDAHEATGAYLLHPRHIPFQPFVAIGGGAIDFVPRDAMNQWRGAGLLEMGFDIPTHSKHIGFRVEGRSLFYRAPNYYTPQISTRSWRVTEEPEVSAFYRF